jgi:HAD superfamily hydrolase (TIGR01549 family)
MRVKAVLFDLIGTTVMEKNGDVISRCFENAFADHKIMLDRDALSRNRGKNKKLMIDEILLSQNISLDKTSDVYTSFEHHVVNDLHNFYANEHAQNVFAYLKNKKIRVGLGSGLPRNLFEKILHHLNWNTQTFDYIGISEELGKSRPSPEMIFEMMRQLRINPTEMLKVGDTVADIQEGKNANVYTAVLLSGTQPKEQLIRERPDLILDSLDDLITKITI